MKILLVSNLYPPNAVGGYERLCAQIADELTGRGHRVSVLTSNWGAVRGPAAALPVERSLELLVGKGGIYAPFEGGTAEREAMGRRNVERLSRRIAAEAPDAILVGNLYFFDPSILSALQGHQRRAVYLLTDVWRIHFADPEFVQAHFREHVLELAPGTEPLVPADAPRLQLERTSAAAASRALSAAELERRRRSEDELANGRLAFQYKGVCHLCGPSTFLVRRAGPATVVLSSRARTETHCTSCGFNEVVRGALQGLDLVAQPGSGESVLVSASDVRVRLWLTAHHPRCTAVASLSACEEGRGFAHAVCLDGTVAELAILAMRLDPGGIAVLGEDFAAAPSGELLGPALEAGFRSAEVSRFWAPEHGYLGREHSITVLRS